MPIKPDVLLEIARIAGTQVGHIYPDLQLVFIPHQAGTFHEVVSTGDYEIQRHGAGKIAKAILDKNNHREKSSFLGLAVDHEIKWLGLASRDNMLALFNVNLDELSDAKAARRMVYHLIWHALDLVDVRQRPEYAAKFRSGPMIPKRSPMNLSRLNLQADVFAGVMSQLLGEDESLNIIARQRAEDSISTISERRAEDFPFVIALESARYAFGEIVGAKPSRTKFMDYARELAMDIGDTFDDHSIRQWWSFSEPGQDMAWRAISKDLILGCAIHTSDDPFVRATAHLIADITGIDPVGGFRLQTTYNAFTHQDNNHLLHREIMEKTFEQAIASGVRVESGQPLIAAANAQNERLAEGAILGWCGHALQSAARAFEQALNNGVSPGQAARLEFESTKDMTSWEALNDISDLLVAQKRKGDIVTLGNIVELAGDNPIFEEIAASVQNTLKDPGYVAKLQSSNEFIIRHTIAPAAPAPAGPQIKGPAPSAPVPSAPVYSVPSMGMGLGGGAGAARQRALNEQARRERQASEMIDDGHIQA